MFGLAQHEKYTYEHYLLLPEGDRRELIEGELLVTPALNEKHQRASINLGCDVKAFVDQHSLGRVYFAPFDVILDDYNVVQPDIVVILNEHFDRLHSEGLRGAPDMVVEILSPSTSSRDRVYKRVQYFRFGVREYWIVDPIAETVECYTRGTKDFDGGVVAQMTSCILPGFEMQITRVFR
jgi:Uma2 family endonuclease